MNRSLSLRALFGLVIFVLGSLQAWDSNAHEGGLLIFFLVSVAIALPAVAWLVPLSSGLWIAALLLSFLLLLVARIFSPVPLPGLFLVLIPGVMALILSGLVAQSGQRP